MAWIRAASPRIDNITRDQGGTWLDAAHASTQIIPVANTKRGHAMEYRLLGRSGLKVSTITLGTMTMGGKGDFA